MCVHILFNCRCVNYTNCGFKLMNNQFNYAQAMNYYKKDNYKCLQQPCSTASANDMKLKMYAVKKHSGKRRREHVVG